MFSRTKLKLNNDTYIIELGKINMNIKCLKVQ